MTTPLFLHCNCVEQGQSIPEMCRLAVVWGFDGLEFRRVRPGLTEKPTDYLDAIASARDKTGLKRVSFGGPGPDLMNPDPSVRRRETDACLAFYEEATRRFEMTVCNTMTGTLLASNTPYLEFDKNGSACATAEQWEWAIAGFREIGDAVAKRGLKLAFETHNCFLHDLPKPARELVERIERNNIGLNFDYGNILLHPLGVPQAEAWATCADRVFLVHVKNLYKLPGHRYYNFIPCPLADGAITWTLDTFGGVQSARPLANGNVLIAAQAGTDVVLTEVDARILLLDFLGFVAPFQELVEGTSGDQDVRQRGHVADGRVIG
ncbi:MAG: sugar phosphate isomerase/epimerase family protein, partial [Verrucomicrobiia bacterium]